MFVYKWIDHWWRMDGLCWSALYNDVIKWKHFSRYWPFVRGIHRSPADSPDKDQWRGVVSLICAWINAWANNSDVGDLRRHRTHYDVTVMFPGTSCPVPNVGNICLVLNDKYMRYPFCICLPVYNVSVHGLPLPKTDWTSYHVPHLCQIYMLG